MTLLRIIAREAQRAKFNTLLSLAAVIVAVGLLVAMTSLSRAAVDATRRLMKDMGFNLLIVPVDVDPARYQALDFRQADMPESYVSTLAAKSNLATHFVGKLQDKIEINGYDAVLTGLAGEVSATSKGKQKPMPTAYVVPEGKVFLGAAISQQLGVEQGDTLEILGERFVVDRVLPYFGTSPDDIRVNVRLEAAQAMLGRPGRINAIDALSCNCPVEAKDLFAAIEDHVHGILPDVRVFPATEVLIARHQTRQMVGALSQVTLVVVLAGAALAIWSLTYLNVRSRRREIGVLRALGFSACRIGMLFLTKILIYAFLGAGIGYYAGVAVAAQIPWETSPIKAPADLLPWILILTPIVACIFGSGPIIVGLLRDPSDLLRDDQT